MGIVLDVDGQHVQAVALRGAARGHHRQVGVFHVGELARGPGGVGRRHQRPGSLSQEAAALAEGLPVAGDPPHALDGRSREGQQVVNYRVIEEGGAVYFVTDRRVTEAQLRIEDEVVRITAERPLQQRPLAQGRT